ncbi:MAG: hypothetical protein EA421_12705 [Gemmatimonadales bacterium]|jgi:DNA-directed RNA polymerase specialized sigma24 family protein|nr:MAG: hypothetical protein EA421_12705 [Gemmatimonadales bacterium]
MRHSFEELVGQELDRLYRAAFFLAEGVPHRAERLVTLAVLGGFREYRSLHRLPTRTAHWFDGHLARAFLDGHGSGAPPGFRATPDEGEASKVSSAPVEAPPGRWDDRLSNLGHEELAQAGAALPPTQRVAFWLVALERRRYGDVAEILGAPRESVAGWIRDAHRTLHRALAALRPGRLGEGRA